MNYVQYGPRTRFEDAIGEPWESLSLPPTDLYSGDFVGWANQIMEQAYKQIAIDLTKELYRSN